MGDISRTVHSIGESPERIVGINAWGAGGWGGGRRLELVGLTDGGLGYEMQRLKPGTGHIVIGYGGQGEVWLKGEWVKCGVGQAYVSPAGRPMGFRTVGRRRWQFAWAYLPEVELAESELLQVDPRPIVNAIEGLYLEATGLARVELLDRWADLAQLYIREITRATEGGVDPLWALWTAVDARLSENWTLSRLSREARLRPEALRRLALKSTGRSPMRQVVHLRMRRAEALLRSTNDKLFTIAQQVGYRNTFAFSTAFRRWKGKAPKSCRGN
jgi:AraC-like DNA-binding protein